MILIENKIAFVSIPKCASVSVHNALENSTYKIEPTYNTSTQNVLFKLPDNISHLFTNENARIKEHKHIPISTIYTFLNSKVDTITIRRDYCKRFISGFYYMFDWWIKEAYGLYYKNGYITNEFIYKYFTDDVIFMIKELMAFGKDTGNDLKLKKALIEPLILHYTSNYNPKKIIEEKLYDNSYINYRIFDSQEAWKSGYKPTYEFDINELSKLEIMLVDKFDKEIKIGKENSRNSINSNINIIHDQKLRDWVWNKFEKEHFTKKIF